MMTIRELTFEYNELKVMLRVELLYGVGDKLRQLYLMLDMLRSALINLNIWFEEDEKLFNNLSKFIEENENINLKEKYKNFDSRKNMMMSIFGDAEKTDKEEEL